MRIGTPEELATLLTCWFPAFRDEWDEGEGYGDIGECSFHTVFIELAPVCARCLASAKPRTVEAFCDLINHFVAEGGNMENAVSTCLLEHASQVGITKLIRRHLSPAAKARLR